MNIKKSLLLTLCIALLAACGSQPNESDGLQLAKSSTVTLAMKTSPQTLAIVATPQVNMPLGSELVIRIKDSENEQYAKREADLRLEEPLWVQVEFCNTSEEAYPLTSVFMSLPEYFRLEGSIIVNTPKEEGEYSLVDANASQTGQENLAFRRENSFSTNWGDSFLLSFDNLCLNPGENATISFRLVLDLDVDGLPNELFMFQWFMKATVEYGDWTKSAFCYLHFDDSVMEAYPEYPRWAKE